MQQYDRLKRSSLPVHRTNELSATHAIVIAFSLSSGHDGAAAVCCRWRPERYRRWLGEWSGSQSPIIAVVRSQLRETASQWSLFCIISTRTSRSGGSSPLPLSPPETGRLQSPCGLL